MAWLTRGEPDPKRKYNHRMDTPFIQIIGTRVFVQRQQISGQRIGACVMIWISDCQCGRCDACLVGQAFLKDCQKNP